ncbi:MAG: metallophosphoesterase [Eubacteriales bacterium]|nr:metallophosphoesterase [Eubacteriales bacterium]
MRKRTVYAWHTGKLSRPARLLVVSDLHNAEYGDILPLLTDVDALLMPGDAADRYRQGYGRALRFIQKASDRLPTFVGVGNHEMRLADFTDFRTAVVQTGARMLFNSYVRFGEMVIGCWYRPEQYGIRDMLPAMEAEEGVRILLCHRPEDYMHRLRKSKVDLVLAGHTHGGQIRLGKQGLYAPGQGFFPKYTRGVVDERMIISAGASNPVYIPRLFNPREVLLIELD